jgi:transcriptional regulator with XRE-family HTH domain
MFYMQNIVGPQVKVARLRLKPRMTQETLAANLQLDGWNISRSGIAKIELGLRQVTDIETMRLAKALGVSPSWLLGETG